MRRGGLFLSWVLSIRYAIEGSGIETDEVYAEVRKEFGEEEVVNLSLAMMSINCWNRLAIGLRKIPVSINHTKIG